MKKKRKLKRRPKRRSPHQEACYVCDSCGEEIVVPVDISAGAHQDYVEDCPVCCHPMSLHVEIDDEGEAHVAGEHE
jgi:transcription elongation factor Elf1